MKPEVKPFTTSRPGDRRAATEAQTIWQARFDLPDLMTDGRQWNRLLDDGDAVKVGGLELSASDGVAPDRCLHVICNQFCRP